MKKIITLFFISFLYSVSVNASDDYNFYEVVGNFTWADETEVFTIFRVGGGVRVTVTDVSGDGVEHWEPIGLPNPTQTTFQVTFSQSTCATTTVNMTVSFLVPTISIPAQITRTVTVKPSSALGPLADVTSGTTGVYANQFYTFSTEAENATSYQWSVYGGTISGSTTGSTINVSPNPGGCSIFVTVRAISVCGYSPQKNLVRPFSAPVYVGDISGNTQVGVYYGDYSAYSSSAYVPNNSIHEYVWSVTGPFQLGSNGTNQTHVFVNTSAGYGSGNLYVYVKNTCGQTITKSKYIQVGNGIPGGGGWGGIAAGDGIGPDAAWVDVVETKVVSNAGELKLIVPNFEEKDLQIYIYNINGRVIEKLQPKSFEVLLNKSKFKNGIYIVKTVSKKEMSTSKFTVSD